MSLDYTCILNCHDEGILAHRAVKSIIAMMDVAKAAGFDGELLVVFDKADAATKTTVLNVIAELPRGEDSSIETSFGDLGLARNEGVNFARGEYVFFFDADDVWGDQWLAMGLGELKKHAKNGIAVVVHPQLIMNFGADKLYWQHTDSRDPRFHPSTFFITNHWTANCGVSRGLLEKHPYREASRDKGFGFEDWEWNSRTWANGVPHVVVPETVHFIRKHHGSMSRTHASQGRTIHPGGIFAEPPAPQPDIGPPPKLSIGEWAHEQTKQAHQIEPEIWADPRDYLERKLYSPPSLPAAWDAYWSLRNVILEAKPTHLIFGAGFGGGADLRVRLYAEQVKAAGKTPIVVWTGGNGSGLPGILTVDGFTPAQMLGEQFPIVLLRIMLESSPITIHIVNSNAAFNAIAFGAGARALAASGARVFASFYAIEQNRDAQLGGYAVNGGMTAVRTALEAVIVDNRSFADELRQQTGWDVCRTAFIPSIVAPVDVPEDKRKAGGPERLLWAGRLEWAKDPLLLATLAAAMPKTEFTVVAVPGDEYGKIALGKLATLPNVRVLPPWTGTMPMELALEHDALIVTSRHEGMPHLVLEALALGLPVVGTHVGGLRDLTRSGFVATVPVDRRADPESWRSAMNQIESKARVARRAADYLLGEHSAKSAANALKEIGYL